MSAASRSELIASTSRDLPYEAALQDPDLQAFTVVCNDIIVGNVQIPAYTDAILQTIRQYGLPMGASDPDIEPTARLVRGNALLDDPTIEKTYLMPLNSLRMVVGSSAITLAAVEHVREIITRTADGTLPGVTIGFFENHNRQTDFDPRTSFTHDYSITESAADTYGHRVWIADSSVLAPAESSPAVTYPYIARLLLAHEDTVINDGALPDIDNALDYLHDRLRAS